LIADGITFSFGVIYAELLDYFQESKGYTAVIGSLFMATPLLSGPLASALTDRFGCRAVTIAGSIVAAIGLFLTSLSSKIRQTKKQLTIIFYLQ
jgi:MFS family permease